MSFEEAYKEFLIFAQKRQKKQSFYVLKYNFNSNILNYFKEIKLEDIKSIDIISWQNFILEKKFCNNTNKNLYGMLKSFFKFCSLHYGFNYNIVEEVGNFKPKYEKKKIDFYTLNEFNKFIRYVDNEIYKQFFCLMFFTGTRPGEAMALKFSDLNDNEITINKTIDEHGKREIGTPKTLSSNRTIIIDYKLKKDLNKLRKYYELKYQMETFDYFIFGGLKPLSPTTINRYKFKACDKANLRAITLHQFRHSHASLLYNNGIDIHNISSRLGHSNISTTLNVYTHCNLDKEKRALETLNSLRIKNVLQYNFYSIYKHFSMFITKWSK